MTTMLTISQGFKNVFGKQLSQLNQQDWLSRFKENLPFKEEEILICGMPETAVSKKVRLGLPLTKAEAQIRKTESTDDVFIFAGFVEPGKH